MERLLLKVLQTYPRNLQKKCSLENNFLYAMDIHQHVLETQESGRTFSSREDAGGHHFCILIQPCQYCRACPTQSCCSCSPIALLQLPGLPCPHAPVAVLLPVSSLLSWAPSGLPQSLSEASGLTLPTCCISLDPTAASCSFHPCALPY